MANSKIIIVEGPQGVGKTTITDYIRNTIPYTNLYRLSGTSDSTPSGKLKSKKMYEDLIEYIEKLQNMMSKNFGIIPSLCLVAPFEDNTRFSEMAVVFLMSYYLGMLVRYYPTHWISLIQGDNGDEYWPILNRAQNYVLQVFPELCVELINDRVDS